MAFTQSFDVEFDDALLDLEGWKNPRYEGTKLTGAQINTYTAGDITYGKNPVIERKTTALYIGNTLVGAENEDTQYAFVKGHSYININKILIIDPDNDEVTIIDSKAEDFFPFQQFVTNDLPTGASFTFRLLDDSVQNSLDENYFVKFNKGWLLKSFTFENPVFGDVQGTLNGGGTETISKNLQTNRPSMIISDDIEDVEGNLGSEFQNALDNRFLFVYGKPYFNSGSVSANADGFFRLYGPSYHDSTTTIYENKFTRQYYGNSSPAQGTGSFGRVTGNEYGGTTNENYGTDQDNPIGNNAFVKTVDFINNKTFDFLTTHNAKDIPIREKTELHITFFKGQELVGANTDDIQDERSINTFEVEKNSTQISRISSQSIDDVNVGVSLPLIVMKGVLPDTRFKYNNLSTSPDIETVIHGARVEGSVKQLTLNFNNRINSRDAIAGGVTSSLGEFNYSGSFEYELSFLDKAPTIISNIDKEVQLYNGVGEKGFVLIPNLLDQRVKDNVEYYLEKAGLIDKTTRNKAPKRGR